MSQSIKVKVRPDQTLLFPEICVHCARPATERLEIRKRRGQITRLIDVPICSNCYGELRLRSAEEERWQRLGLLATGGMGIILFVACIIVIPAILPLWLRLIPALIVAILAAAGVRSIFQKKSLAAARPQKKAILNSVRMVYFSWRATTFEFENDAFAQWFEKLNEASLMEA